MKKFLCILTLLCVCITLFSCSKNIDEQMAEPLDKGEQAPVVEQQKPIDEQPVEEQKEPERPAPTDDKAPWCTNTIDEPFSDGEVVVTFTIEESAKDGFYTPAHFSGYDIFNVFEFDYFPEEYHPEYKGRKTVIIMLNEPSKERVLEYVRKLEDDPRVYSACPNFIFDTTENEYDTYYVFLTEEQTKKQLAYTTEDFSNVGITYISPTIKQMAEDYDCVYGQMLEVRLEKDNYEKVKKLAADERIRNVMLPIGSYEPNCIFITLNDDAERKEYTCADFPNFNFKNIKTIWSGVDSDDITLLVADLSNPGYENLCKEYFKLIKDERIKRAGLNDKVYVVN